MYKNNLKLKSTGQNVDRSSRRVLGTILRFGWSFMKEPYFDHISGVSTKSISALDLKLTHSKPTLIQFGSLWTHSEKDTLPNKNF